jgi:hypothetical protein
MAREVACQMVESFCSKDFQRKKQIIEMLTTFLADMSHAGEAAQEFVHLYQRLITPDQVRLLLEPSFCKKRQKKSRERNWFGEQGKPEGSE